MAYAEIPRDVTKIKRKVVAGLTKRQLVCFGIAAAVGVPLFFLLRKPLGATTAAYIMVFTMMPAMLFAFYEKNGLPLEQYLRCMFQVMFFRAKERPYRTNNIYDRLYYDILLEKEVEAIVETAKQGKQKRTPNAKGKQCKPQEAKADAKQQAKQADAKAAGRKKAAARRAEGSQGSKSPGGSGA